MFYTLAVILLIAWLLGVVGTYTIGAFVHLLLVVALVLFAVRTVQRTAERSSRSEGIDGWSITPSRSPLAFPTSNPRHAMSR